jgi:hypothetical protein
MSTAFRIPLSPGTSSPSWPSARRHRVSPPPRLAAAAPLLLASLLVLAAHLLAPERPWDQEAICQRHNGVEACRVW